jgi:hypothetical protein
MIICLGDATATVREWEDADAAKLSGLAGMNALGRLGPSDGSFFTVKMERLTDPRTTFVIGLQGARPSSTPILLGCTWSDAVWIGADQAVYSINIHTGHVKESGFESPFTEFYVSSKLNVLVAVCESGMRCFNADGSERWRTDTDLIEDLRWTEDTVTVEQLGQPSAVISLEDGHIAT